MPLSLILHNRLDDLINSSDKEDVISRHQNRNSINTLLPASERDRTAGHFESKE